MAKFKYIISKVKCDKTYITKFEGEGSNADIAFRRALNKMLSVYPNVTYYEIETYRYNKQINDYEFVQTVSDIFDKSKII